MRTRSLHIPKTTGCYGPYRPAARPHPPTTRSGSDDWPSARRFVSVRLERLKVASSHVSPRHSDGGRVDVERAGHPIVLEQLLGSHLIRTAVIKGKADCQRPDRRCGSRSGKYERGYHQDEHRKADPTVWGAAQPKLTPSRSSGAAFLVTALPPRSNSGVRCGSSIRRGCTSGRSRPLYGACSCTPASVDPCEHAAGIAVGFRLSDQTWALLPLTF